MDLNRRDFGKLALAAIPAARLLGAKPNSNFGGVQVGAITYSYREMPDANNAVSVLKYTVDSGISGIEMMAPAAENFAGSPAATQGRGGRGGAPGAGGPAGPAGGPGGPGAPGGGRGRAPLTPEQQAMQAENARKLKDWRLSVSMDKYKELRKMYNDAGVSIYGFKLPPTKDMSDEEYEYIFKVGSTLGAHQITAELSDDAALTQRNGDFAAKHGMVVAYHAHTQATITAWDAVLAQSKGNAVNLDCGHYVAGTGLSPIPVIQKLHGRIASIHLKDRTTPEHGAKNLAWGTGDTPIKEILQLMRKEKYTFPASVELEYQVPQGSDAVTEVLKCVEYCRNALA